MFCRVIYIEKFIIVCRKKKFYFKCVKLFLLFGGNLCINE